MSFFREEEDARIFFLLSFTASRNRFLSAFAALLMAFCVRSSASCAFFASSSSLRTTMSRASSAYKTPPRCRCIRLVRLRRLASASWLALISLAASAPACACASPPVRAVLSLRFRLGVVSSRRQTSL
ncbi:hypothetical protein FN846DRAFT_935864 [Sphaerosporella brunnea]|uniref:Uncharacterized protein n=1 Tax=Sphaerosporella brunnea TaxID=1250544 RepID=A0A5J5F577_9PEZI|nr:hypothetical protein FN846DRAFT_935864 [Sphaerosporella brunnea]